MEMRPTVSAGFGVCGSAPLGIPVLPDVRHFVDRHRPARGAGGTLGPAITTGFVAGRDAAQRS